MVKSSVGAGAADVSTADLVAEGRRVVGLEQRALVKLMDGFDASFAHAVTLMTECRGKLIFSGMGKAGLIAQKVAATFSSLGKAAVFLHPAEAAHGDLGMITAGDQLICFSNSGETPELTAILQPVKKLGVKLLAITATAESTLARESDVVLTIGKLEEACSLGLAPTTSTTVMLTLGDALAVTYLKLNKDFDERAFAFYHPGGSLGQRYTLVSDVMRKGADHVVTARVDELLQGVLVRMTAARVGVAVICDAAMHVCGVFSDGDLRRALETGGANILTQAIAQFMSTQPTVIAGGEYVAKAVELMKGYKIGEMPVVDKAGSFRGLLVLKDVV